MATKLAKIPAPNQEAETDYDIVPIEFFMELVETHIEGNRIVEKKLDVLIVKGFAEKHSVDVDSILYRDQDVKPLLEMVRAAKVIKEAAHKWGRELFDGVPGVNDHGIRMKLCSSTEPIFKPNVREVL